MLVEGQYVITTTNMAATYLVLFKLGFLQSWRRLYKPIPTSGFMPFLPAVSNHAKIMKAFRMWVTSSEPDCKYFNGSSASPLGDTCQTLKSS